MVFKKKRISDEDLAEGIAWMSADLISSTGNELLAVQDLLCMLFELQQRRRDEANPVAAHKALRSALRESRIREREAAEIIDAAMSWLTDGTPDSSKVFERAGNWLKAHEKEVPPFTRTLAVENLDAD